MKKLASILLALCVVIAFAVPSFASEILTSESVLAEVDSTVAYLTAEIESYTVDSAIDYYYLSLISTEADSYYEEFLQSVEKNLAENDGKIVSAYGENMTTYAAVISILDTFGDDPTDVNGVDLVELMEATETSSISNPYYYNIVIPAASLFCEEEFVLAICDEFIENYYTLGSGMNYWGYACDNTAMFISAIAQSGYYCYEDVLADAMEVLESYKVEGGYCYNPDYGTEASSDSTGLALMAKCAYYFFTDTVEENMEELTDLYNELLAFKGDTEGSYTYAGSESAYSAMDALRGLNMYEAITVFYEMSNVVDDDENNSNDNNNSGNNDNNSNNTNSNNTNGNSSNNNQNVVIPNTSVNTSNGAFALMAISAAAIFITLKKKEN